MPTWGHGIELQQNLPMLLIPRLGSAVVQAAQNIEVLDVDVPYSSTLVREAVRAGEPADHLVCDGVMRYIEQNRLYAAA